MTMTKHLFTFLLILSFTSSLSANDVEEFSNLDIAPSSSLASTEGLVNSIIDGSVCAITGEFVDFETDLIVPGPEPLYLRRSYSSQDRVKGNGKDPLVVQNDLYQGWSLGLTSLINVAKGKSTMNKNKYYASISIPSGPKICYKKQVHKGHQNDTKEYHFNLIKGFTNSCGGKISAATNMYLLIVKKFSEWAKMIS